MDMPLTANTRTEVLVIGAGMAGIAAAGRLQNSGKAVIVLEKGRGVGGRMATRRIGDCTFDHGAQFVTARSAHFLETIQVLEKAGVAKSWGKEFSTKQDGHTRWRGKPSMNAIPKFLSKNYPFTWRQR